MSDDRIYELEFPIPIPFAHDLDDHNQRQDQRRALPGDTTDVADRHTQRSGFDEAGRDGVDADRAAEHTPDQHHTELPLYVALHGYADAGQAVMGSAVHLKQALDHELVATFKVDELLDYRSRRPGITMDNAQVIDREDVSITLQALTDTEGNRFLLLSGPEPDLRWEAFSDAVVDLSKRLGVTKVLTFYSVPMTMPHTRPLIVTGHASDPALVRDMENWESRMIIPGSAALDTELKLSRQGIDTIGLSAQVPHYIASSDYPEATFKLLDHASQLSGRTLPLGALRAEADRMQQNLAEQVQDSPEIANVVSTLEARYDQEVERRRSKRENNLLRPGQDLPTGEEIGAELEAFLKSVNDERGDELGDERADEA